LSKERDFVYGTWFYSPMDIRPERFRPLLTDLVRRDQLNLIRVFPTWDYCNPARDQYRFDDLELLFTVCDELNIHVLMSVMLESAPYWLEEANPETRLVDADGHAVHLQGLGFHFTGGYPGLCFDNEPVRDAAKAFMQALARLSMKHRSTFAYSIWNEPAYVDLNSQELHSELPIPKKLFCYCERSLAEFRARLQRKYPTLDELNNTWIRGYSAWSTVEPPRDALGTSADWLDWRRFIEDRTTDHLRFRVETIRSIDAGRIIETHAAYAPAVGPTTIRGINQWRLAQEVDVYGCSFYRDFYNWTLDRAAAQLDITRSCANGKEFWISEMQGGAVGAGYYRGPPLRPRQIRTQNWLAMTAGAKGIVYYSYLDEATGAEASHFGLVDRSGASSERIEEVAKFHRLVQPRWQSLKDYQPRPLAALLLDQDNAVLTFSAFGKEDPSIESFAGYYKAFWQLDLRLDCIQPESTDLGKYKILIVPWHLIGKVATCKKLISYVEQGGILLLETGFAKYDADGVLNDTVPGNGMDKYFGYREGESLRVIDGRLPLESLDQEPGGDQDYEAFLEFSQPERFRVKANTYVTPVVISSATAIATCRQWIVAAMQSVGRGRIYYVGTNLGGSVFNGDAGGIELIRALAAGVVNPEVTGAGQLRPRLIKTPKLSLLVVFNDADRGLTERIKLPNRYKRAIDLYSDVRHSIDIDTLEVTVPFKDVGVFELS